MQTEYSTETDKKQRWAGIFENPFVSKVQRHCLDGFKVTGLARILKNVNLGDMLDVGCGWGEYSNLKRGRYVGLDNSFARVRFAKDFCKGCSFMQADAKRLPFKDGSFDTVLFANIAHHLSDDEFKVIFEQITRATRKYLIIDDCALSDEQGKLSKFFYSLDRGTMFRHSRDFEKIFSQFPQFRVVAKDFHVTFPGIYLHVVFVLEKV